MSTNRSDPELEKALADMARYRRALFATLRQVEKATDGVVETLADLYYRNPENEDVRAACIEISESLSAVHYAIQR